MDTKNINIPKEERIAELQRQIEEIKAEKPVNFALVKVIPDCGAGIKDSETVVAISHTTNLLTLHCKKEYNERPVLDNKKPSDKKPCETWYKIITTPIQLVTGKKTTKELRDEFHEKLNDKKNGN